MAQAHFEPTWALIHRPEGYPTGPSVGKSEMIWNTNKHSLYHRLSPYTDYDKGLLNKLLGNTEPFYYIYPDKNDSFPNSAKKYESRLYPAGSAPIDVIRVSKFLVSGRGVGFLSKQFLLQTASPYNERRIYNPASTVIAAGMTLTLGAIRPERMFDTSAGISGLVGTLFGSVGSAILGPPKTNPVAGTTLVNNSLALPDSTKTIGTKGLLRAGDALMGQSHLQAAWQGKGNPKFSLKGLISNLFQNFIPQTQDGIQYRSDEGTYGLMVGAGTFHFKSVNKRGGIEDFHQLFIGGGNITRKEGEYPSEASRFFMAPNGTPNIIKVLSLGNQPAIPSVGSVGYSVDESTDSNSLGYRYGDVVGSENDDNFESSDVMIQYGQYATPGQNYKTKDPEAQRASDTKTKLTAVIDKIRAASEGTYKVDSDQNSILLMRDSVQYNYDRLFKTKNKNDNPNNFSMGALSAYRFEGVTMVSSDLVDNVQKSLKLPTAGKFDAINTLSVLDSARSTMDSPLAGRWAVWEPYKDDLIALYFYDVVNEKYIPFRAAIKGILEAGNASWEEMPFIGRADKVYSYGGFNRNLSFNLQVVISSIAELAPTWQRINYIMTSYKPSNYTKSKRVVVNGNSSYDRFMIAPMFMLTMGDLYRDQPILIQSVTLTIPDDAAWETYNEDNVGAGNWGYMANLISAPNVKFGQVPREVELGFTAVLLEKERAVVGGANFGHAPRTEEFREWNIDTVPNGKAPNSWNKNYMVNVINSGVTDSTGPSTSTSTATQPFTLLSTTAPSALTVPTPISNIRRNNVAPLFP